MSAQHTPTPWHVIDGSCPIADTGDYEAFLYVSADEKGKSSICHFEPEYSRDIDEEQVYANASLVSASPDMYEVLKRYEKWEAHLIEEDSMWELGVTPRFTDALYEELMEIQQLRNAAIEKATRKNED